MILNILIVILILKLCVQFYLTQLNDKHLSSFTFATLPEKIRNLFTPSDFEKTVQYNLEKSRFSTYASFFYTCLVIAIILPPYPNYLYWFFDGKIGGQVAFLLCVLGFEFLWSMGKGYISQFYIEEKYGFNKSTKLLWLKDTLIGLFLNAFFMTLIFGLFIYLSTNVQYWWFWSFLFVMGFGLFMMVISPYVIEPLFNKFSELKNDQLKEELMLLAKKSNFTANKVLVMDGSKRSKHSNAYFSGFGKFRRIVLYDTLVEQLSINELKAVLAHEIGHYKRGHIPKSMLMSSVMLFVMFYGLSIIQNSSWVYVSLGFNESYTGKIAPLFFFFLLLGDSWMYFINPIFSKISRKFEYEADAYAKAALGEGKSLVDALGKLTSENMSNPVPHPIYSGFYYSHPTLSERSKALQKDSDKA